MMLGLRKAATLLLTCAFATAAHAELRALIVSGLGGEPGFESEFRRQAESVAAAAIKIAVSPTDVVLLKGDQARATDVQRELRALAKSSTSTDQLLVVFIGHGSYDGQEYRYNLPGPDLTGRQLLDLLNDIPARQQLIVNTTSASGAVLEQWKRPGRIVVTATRSGGERNATHFARYWVEALTSAEADRDKDERVTVQEAFEFATRKVNDAYKSDVAIATEHAQLAGEGGAQFSVAYFGDVARFATDPELVAMRRELVAAEQSLDQLRSSKATLDGKVYYDQLEQALVTLAKVDRRIDGRLAALGANGNANKNTSKEAKP